MAYALVSEASPERVVGSSPTVPIILTCMRHLFLVFLLAGCVAEVSSSSEQNLIDNQLENRYDEEVWTEPQGVPGLTVDLETDQEFFVDFDMCVCEWNTWRDTRGFLCLGVVCSNGCPREVSECRESRTACVPHM